MKQHITAVYDDVETIRVFRHFAYAKLLAQQSKIKDYRDLFTHPWLVTRTEVVHPWTSRAELDQLIKREIVFQQERCRLVTQRPDGPVSLKEFFEAMRRATMRFFETYRMMEAENSQINEDAAYVLGISQRSAAVARGCADISLAWIGLLSGPAVICWNMASRRFILYQAEAATMPFILKKLGVGLAGAFGTKIAENWQEAASADFVMVQAGNNTPGFVDDSWKSFFAALNMQVERTLIRAYSASVAGLGQEATNLWGMNLSDPRIEQVAARHNALRASAQIAGQRLDNYAPKGAGPLAGGVKWIFKGAAYGLAVKSTVDSLSLLTQQWQLDTRK